MALNEYLIMHACIYSELGNVPERCTDEPRYSTFLTQANVNLSLFKLFALDTVKQL
jgi:hypothetical protein